MQQLYIDQKEQLCFAVLWVELHALVVRHIDLEVAQKTRVENTDQCSTAFLVAFMNTASPLCVLLSITHTQTHTEVWNPVTLFDMS